MTAPRRVVITGGAGFIGSHFIDRLLSNGGEVVCFDNMITGSVDNVSEYLGNPRFSLREQDVSAGLEVKGDVDWVLHLAAPASPVGYLRHPIETLDVGTLGTRAALELARSKRARLLLASTSEVYGDPLVHPQSESYWGNVNPIGPRSVYDESKRAAEAFVMAYHRTFGIATRIARIFNTYGPRMAQADGRAVPQFIGQALAGKPLTVYGDGSQTRSLCYVDDLVAGLEKLAQSDCVFPINLGNPHEVTMLELAQTIIRLCGSSSDIEFAPLPVDDPKRRRPDISAAREHLRWEPAVPMEEGLARTIAWWRQTREPGNA